MNRLQRFSVWIGFSVIGYILYGVISHSARPALYLDVHALMIVVLGTLGVSLVAFPIRKITDILDFVLMGVLFKKRHKTKVEVITEILLAIEYFLQKKSVYELSFRSPFVKECFTFLEGAHMSPDNLSMILHERKNSVLSKYFDDAKTLVAVSKFPPALGLLGASTGMIEMMQQVGGAGGMAQIGKSMAVALVATFWGIAVANFIILPLSDLAMKEAEDESELRNMAIDTVFMLSKEYQLDTVLDYLVSKLSLKERVEMKSTFRAFLKRHQSDSPQVRQMLSPIFDSTATNIKIKKAR
jgi:chemotaxis protein MotA